MCAAWKKKNERNEIVCFYCTQSDILLRGIARTSQGKKNKLRTFQPQKWKKKLRTAILKQNLLILIKKRECNVPTVQMPIFALFLRAWVLFDGAFSQWVSLNLTITFSLQYDKSLSIFVFTLVLNQVKSYLNMTKQKLTPFQETWN